MFSMPQEVAMREGGDLAESAIAEERASEGGTLQAGRENHGQVRGQPLHRRLALPGCTRIRWLKLGLVT